MGIGPGERVTATSAGIKEDGSGLDVGEREEVEWMNVVYMATRIGIFVVAEMISHAPSRLQTTMTQLVILH